MKLLDSSVWLAHLLEANTKASALIEADENLFCSLLSLFEVKKKLIKEQFMVEKVQASLEFIKKRAIIVNLSEEMVHSAVELSLTYKLSTVDALIYASALNLKAEFITADNDFRGLKDAIIID